MKVVYESDQFESIHEGSNLDDWDDDSADPLDFQKYKRIGYGSPMEDDSLHPFESNSNDMIDHLRTKVKRMEALIQQLIQHGPQAQDVHEIGQRRLKVELRVIKLCKQVLLLKTSHGEISKDVGLLMQFIRDFIGHERSDLTSLQDTMDMIRQVDVRLCEIDQHVAQVQNKATQITRVATVVDEMVQEIRYGGSVVEPNASVFDLFQGLVSKGKFQFFRNKVSELEQFNTQQSKVFYDSYMQDVHPRLQTIENDFIGRGEYLQALRFVKEETDRLQLEINHYHVVNDHNQGILAKRLEELRGKLQEVTRVHHSDVSTFRVELEQCQHAIGEMHCASASYVSQVSFRQLGNKVDTIGHQLREPFVTVKAIQKLTTDFVSMQGKFWVFEESMEQIQMTANGNPPPNPSLVAFEGNISELSLRLDRLASAISSLHHSWSAFDSRLSSFSSRFDGVESFIAPLPQAVEAIRRQSTTEFPIRLARCACYFLTKDGLTS